jgi:hypothetical protein
MRPYLTDLGLDAVLISPVTSQTQATSDATPLPEPYMG